MIALCCYIFCTHLYNVHAYIYTGAWGKDPSPLFFYTKTHSLAGGVLQKAVVYRKFPDYLNEICYARALKGIYIKGRISYPWGLNRLRRVLNHL